MKEKEILECIDELSQQQGFYCGLKAKLDELRETDSAKYNEIIKGWEAQNFTDKVDFVMYIEG